MDELALRDIHLPEPVGWWPPAPGWWLVIIGLPLLTAASLILYKRLTRKSAIKTARKQLKVLRQNRQLDTLQTLAALSVLLKRVAISTADRHNTASLSGAAWLTYLDSSFKDAPFSQGPGRILAQAPYQRSAPEAIDLEALFVLCEQWLKRQDR